MSTPLADAAAREAIDRQLDVSMLVEAAAGTGKTTKLVDRMVALLDAGRCTIDQLVAITFTRKAAAELRQRFQERLENLGMDEARENLQRCFIGTVHAFCARLLRERPVEAGVDPSFEELEEDQAAALLREVWRDHTERLFAEGHPVLPELRNAGVRIADLQDAFLTLCAYGDVEFPAERTAKPTLRPASKAVLDLYQRAARAMPAEEPDKGWDELQKLVREIDKRIRTTAFENDADAVALLELAERFKSVTLIRWPDEALARQLRTQLRDIRDHEVKPALRRWREYLYPLLLEVLVPAVRESARRRKKGGRLSFDDLLRLTRDMLRGSATARAYFRRRFTHILVDEFQDTDPLQAEVLFFLTGESDAPDWREQRPRPGSLFIVGDPKQSIYRFRRADITTYGEVRRLLEDSGGIVVRLSTNFRSLPAICAHANHVFRTIFGTDPEAQAEFVPLDPFRESSGAGTGIRVLRTAYGTKESVAESEAPRVAAWIGAEVAAGRRSFGEILLISWNTTRLGVYAEALESAGIPYEVTGEKAFCRAEELVVLEPLLRALVDPDDPVALVAVLRGPLFGVDDDALYHFRAEGGTFSYRVPPEALKEKDARIARAFGMMKDWRRCIDELPPAAALARIVEQLGLIPWAAVQHQGETRSGNLLKLGMLARRFSADGQSFESIAARLEDLVERGSEMEGMPAEPAREDVVRLMNLHQAKGLEAPVVFLIDPADPFDHGVTLWIDRKANPPQGFIRIVGRKTGGWRPAPVLGQPLDWEAKAATEKRFETCEDDRELYVAATRAKDLLVVGTLVDPQKDRDHAWKRLALPSLVELEFEQAPEAARGRRQTRTAVEAARMQIAARKDAARIPTTEVLPITKYVKKSALEYDQEEGAGRGPSWGRVLHRMLEALLRDPAVDIPLHAANLLVEEERPLDEREEVVRLVDAVRGSGLWQRALGASERYVEIPFAVMVPSEGTAGETLLHGAIDLVFREGDTWWIVDYKSDRGDPDRLAAHYAPQVEAYVRFWSEITGQPARGGLFFLDGLVERWI